jgi:uncharacterized membrane protein YbhN (UPF0104 family)
MKRVLDFLWPVIGLAAVVFSFWLLVRELRGLSAADIWTSLRAIPPHSYLLAFGSTILAYGALAWYDRIALLHLQKPLSWIFISLTSFTTYALSHNIGVSVVSGAVVRYRAYSSKGLSVAEVALLVAFCSFTFGLGTLTLTGLVLTIDPGIVVRLFNVPLSAARLTGIGLIVLVGLYVLGSLLHLRPLIIGNFRLVYPRPAITIRQLFAGPLELIGAAGIIYFALPDSANPGFIVVLGVFLASFSAALLSHAPGGLGVLEFVFIKAMPDAPHAQVLAALIVFRLFYLILPLAFGIAVVVIFERGRLAEALRQKGLLGAGARTPAADEPPPPLP